MRIFHLFIGHSWCHGGQYGRLKNLLDNGRPSYRDYAVPRDGPIHSAGSVRQLREAIKNQMQYASVVLVLAGVDASHSKWINSEANLAASSFCSAKPIVAIEPWGSERTSARVKQAADRIVGWSTGRIVRVIEELA